MDLWQNREKAKKFVQNELSEEYDVIYQLFKLQNDLIECYIVEKDNDILRIAGIINAKIRSLCHAMLSLAFDGNAQESGAIFRPAIEAYEKLVYLREDSKRVQQFIEGNLPTAGVIARKINGKFKEVREYLNKNASHFGLEYYSIRHLVQIHEDGRYTLKPPTISLKVLKENVGTLAVFMIHVLIESIECLNEYGIKTIELEKRLEILFIQVNEIFVKIK